jgi:hypothetical protein
MFIRFLAAANWKTLSPNTVSESSLVGMRAYWRRPGLVSSKSYAEACTRCSRTQSRAEPRSDFALYHGPPGTEFLDKLRPALQCVSTVCSTVGLWCSKLVGRLK